MIRAPSVTRQPTGKRSMPNGSIFDASASDESPNELRDLCGMGHVKAVAIGIDHLKLAVGKLVVHIPPYRRRGEGVARALQHQDPMLGLTEEIPMVGKKGRFGEGLGGYRIGRAKALRKFFRQPRIGRLPGDEGGKVMRPADVIPVHQVNEFLEIAPLEAPGVSGQVEKAGRGANHNDVGEALWRISGGHQPDCATNRMPNECGAVQIECIANLAQILGITFQLTMPDRVESRDVRVAATCVIEENEAKVLQIRLKPTPHVLVAAEAVCEHERMLAIATHNHIVPVQTFLM
ncbi:hypothetical protein V8352_19275 [Roseovarius sp. D0-M9]